MNPNRRKYGEFIKELEEKNKASSSSKRYNPRTKTSSYFDKGKDKKNKSRTENVSKPAIQEKDPNIPDRSYGDYFCPICDSHMNSEDMWNSHISGKKHQKNVTKGDTESKYDELDVESDIKYEVRNVKDPIVGLSYIHEIRRKEKNVPPFYNCFICHATIATIPLVIEHVISMKHRLNFIKLYDQEGYELLQATNLKKDHLEPLVHEAALKLEQKYGRGEVVVKQEKAKSIIPLKRSYCSGGDDDDDDDDSNNQRLVKKPKSGIPEPHVWKSVDSPKLLDNKKERIKKDRKADYYPDEPSPRYSSKKSLPIDKRDISPVQSKSSNYPIQINLSYKKRFETDDYPKQSEYDDDYLQQRDLRDLLNDKHKRYPKSEPKIPYTQDQVKENYGPSTHKSTEYYPQASPHMSGSNLLPHEIIKTNETKSFTDASFLKDFLQTVLELPSEIFLKIFALKLENMDIKATEELSLLSKLVIKAQEKLYQNLPAELQDLMKQKFHNPAAPSSTNSTLITASSSEVPNIKSKPAEPQSDISFIKDILKSVNSVNSSTVSQAASTHQFINSTTPIDQNASLQQYTNSYQRSHQNSHGTPYHYPNSTTNNQNVVQQYTNSYANPLHNSHSSVPPQNNPLENYSYNNSQSNLTSAIPGLSLADSGNPEPQPYSFQNLPSQTNYPYRY